MLRVRVPLELEVRKLLEKELFTINFCHPVRQGIPALESLQKQRQHEKSLKPSKKPAKLKENAKQPKLSGLLPVCEKNILLLSTFKQIMTSCGQCCYIQFGRFLVVFIHTYRSLFISWWLKTQFGIVTFMGNLDDTNKN